MTKVLLLALSLPLVACTVGGSPGNPGGVDGSTGGSGADAGSGGGSGISGTITADTTWSGETNLLGSVTINAGVTVTVAPGATVKTSNNAQIFVNGRLDEQGTKASTIAVNGVSIAVKMGGTLVTSYAIHTGGDINTVTGATATLTDTVLSHAGGDFFVMSGGTATMTYSQIGVGLPTDATKGADTTHCDLHINAVAGTVLTVTNSNIASSAYGIMLYQGGADLSNNNWYGNTNDFEPGVSGVTGAKADGGYFKAGMPTGVQGVSFANLSPTPLVAGPR